MGSYRMHLGNCLAVMKKLPDNSVDSIVTDPPYALATGSGSSGFMGKSWDGATGFKDSLYEVDGESHHKSTSRLYQAFSEAWAREALRVLKPGGHLLAFSSTRTYHRMTTGVEDAGFEIRDLIAWVFGQGMPKSLNVGKAIDNSGGLSPQEQAIILFQRRQQAGIDRSTLADLVGCSESSIRDWEEGRSRKKGAPLEFMVPCKTYRKKLAGILGYTKDERRAVGVALDRRGDDTVLGLGHTGVIMEGGNTYLSKQWGGWGTSLKPALEPVVLARKPLIGTVVQNVLIPRSRRD